MIALLLVSFAALLFGALGYRWFSARELGSARTRTRNRATDFLNYYGAIFCRAAVVVALCVFFLTGLNYAIALYGSLGAVALLLALFALPSLFFTPKLGVAAAAARNTDERPGDVVNLPVAAATIIYEGTLVARDAAGRAVPASDTAGLRVVGRAEKTIDNSDGAAGDLSIDIKLGCFKFTNSGTAAVDQDDIGKMCVVEDDQTVAEGGTNNLITAGRIMGLDDDDASVWVNTRFAFFGPRTLPTLASTDGTMGAAADDAATKAEGEKIGDDVRALHSSLFG